MVLLDAGWDAVNLGPNTPLKSLSIAVSELRPKLVSLSMTHPVDKAKFRHDYLALHRRLKNRAQL
jgi:methanogenic corrinoid protein MtbC1